jgi:hypothetical protein
MVLRARHVREPDYQRKNFIVEYRPPISKLPDTWQLCGRTFVQKVSEGPSQFCLGTLKRLGYLKRYQSFKRLGQSAKLLLRHDHMVEFVWARYTNPLRRNGCALDHLSAWHVQQRIN